MDELRGKFVAVAGILACCLGAIYLAIFRPAYLSSEVYLGGLAVLQIVLAAVWNFRRWFFALLMGVFMAAGMSVPYQEAWTSIRWFVLAVAAIAGFAAYMRDRRHNFSTFHLLGIAAALAAVASAVVSASPQVALLKAASLVLLFLYAGSGGRLALLGRETAFIEGLLLISEIAVYLSAVLYLIFRFPLYGNPNSLGAVMGVVFAPLLVWGVLTDPRREARHRRTPALVVAVLLLLFSQARAAIVAGAVSSILLCLALRRYRWMTLAAMVTIFAAVIGFALTPVGSEEQGIPVRHPGASLTSHFIYKGEDDVLSSRKSPWQESTEAIAKHPWLGSGFGTTWVSDTDGLRFGKFSSPSLVTREHGDSYLALAEWVGLLGSCPFLALLLLIIINLGRVLHWLHSGGDARQPMVPIAIILAAGLIHAGFEDWLLAVGYYLSVFFWVLAFGFIDLTAPLRIGRTATLKGRPVVTPRPLTAPLSLR